MLRGGTEGLNRVWIASLIRLDRVAKDPGGIKHYPAAGQQQSAGQQQGDQNRKAGQKYFHSSGAGKQKHQNKKPKTAMSQGTQAGRHQHGGDQIKIDAHQAVAAPNHYQWRGCQPKQDEGPLDDAQTFKEMPQCGDSIPSHPPRRREMVGLPKFQITEANHG